MSSTRDNSDQSHHHVIMCHLLKQRPIRSIHISGQFVSHTQLIKHHQSSTRYHNQFSAITKPTHNLTLLTATARCKSHQFHRSYHRQHRTAVRQMQAARYIYTSSSSQKWNKLPPFPSPFPRGITNFGPCLFHPCLLVLRRCPAHLPFCALFDAPLYYNDSLMYNSYCPPGPRKMQILVADMLMLDGCPIIRAKVAKPYR